MRNGNFSDGEWKIMNALWREGPSSITQLVRALEEETGWEKHTVIVMLNRLAANDAVGYRVEGRTRFYYPKVDQQKAAADAAGKFLNRVYEGSIGLMVTSMANEKALTKKDINELYEILKQAEEE